MTLESNSALVFQIVVSFSFCFRVVAVNLLHRCTLFCTFNLYVLGVTNINFLPTTSTHNREKRLWELMKWKEKPKFWSLNKFSQLFFKEMHKTGAFVCGYITALRVNAIQPIKLSSLETSLIPIDKSFTVLIGGELFGAKGQSKNNQKRLRR